MKQQVFFSFYEVMTPESLIVFNEDYLQHKKEVEEKLKNFGNTTIFLSRLSQKEGVVKKEVVVDVLGSSSSGVSVFLEEDTFGVHNPGIALILSTDKISGQIPSLRGDVRIFDVIEKYSQFLIDVKNFLSIKMKNEVTSSIYFRTKDSHETIKIFGVVNFIGEDYFEITDPLRVYFFGAEEFQPKKFTGVKRFYFNSLNDYVYRCL